MCSKGGVLMVECGGDEMLKFVHALSVASLRAGRMMRSIVIHID